MTSRAWPALALVAAMCIQGCGERIESPTVSGIVPAGAPAGAEVIITGQALGVSGKLQTEQGTEIPTKSWGSRNVTFKVPDELPPGEHQLFVVVEAGRAGPVSFRKLKVAPILLGIDDSRLKIGQVVTLRGQLFGQAQGSSKLTVWDTLVTQIESWSDNAIKFKVPAPADRASQAGVVVTVDGMASNELPLDLAKPFAQRVHPDPAPQGWTVEIKGQNFGETRGQVQFGKEQAEVVSWSDDTISAKLPKNLNGDARFQVVNPQGSSYPVQIHIMAPPTSGAVTSAPAGKQLELVLDQFDFPHLFGYDPDKNVLAYSFWNGAAWMSEVLKPGIGPEAPAKLVTPLEEKIRQLTEENAKSPNRDPKILEEKIKDLVAREQAAVTNQAKESVSLAGLFPRAAIDAQQALHLVFHDVFQQKIIYSWREADEFKFRPVRPAKGQADGLFAAVVPGPADAIHVALMDNAGGIPLLATKDGDAFKVQPADTKDKAGLAMSLAVDSKGNPHLAYLDFGTFDLRAASREGANFRADVVDAEGWTGDTPSLVVDASGTPHVAYLKRDDQGMIASGVRYATRAGGKWAVESVEDGPGIGAQPTVTLDAKGTLRLFYMDTQKKQLRVAMRDGKSWKKTSIPLDIAPTIEPGQVRVAVGGDGRARVAYWQGEPARMRYRILD